MDDSSPATRDEWIQLGEAVHGSFGSLIALGIRIGDQALRDLESDKRSVDVTYFSGPAAPCPCIVDGVMIATASSPGQGTLRVAAAPANDGEFARIVVKHRRSARLVEYVVPMSAWPLLRSANEGAPERRWSAVMDAPASALFRRVERQRGD